ncbi:hypothetical protein Patl1_09665 [Pistacia atlantica]|uniref:Uncharacterized protein n=1 Tax=Pistacia atlantica TaxID=434234 RepID=A0ACC1A006_9ROSI|nr:hypothetical protein Patl1_09665 [Pistacia atlantica]
MLARLVHILSGQEPSTYQKSKSHVSFVVWLVGFGVDVIERNHVLMAQDDARQSLLSRNGVPANFSGNTALQRRKSWCGETSALLNKSISLGENNIQSLLRSGSSIDQQEIRFKQVFVLLVAYLGAGTVCFYLVRHQIEGKKTNGIFDAMYFCVVTMTTTGYGDLVPRSTLAKLIACIYVFTGMALAGFTLGKAADYLVEKHEILFVKAMSKIEKVGSAEILKEAKVHKAKYKFLMSTVMLLVLIIVGILFLILVEKLKPVDAFYCVCSTITTLGYGDESFSTGVGRIFAVFWILSSTLCLAQFFLCLTELYTESRQKSRIERALTRNLTFSDLEAADLDHDRKVRCGWFYDFGLKKSELGKL